MRGEMSDFHEPKVWLFADASEALPTLPVSEYTKCTALWDPEIWMKSERHSPGNHEEWLIIPVSGLEAVA